MAHGDVYTKMECDGCHREFMLAGDGEWGELDMLESNDWTTEHPLRFCETCSRWRREIADLLYEARRLQAALIQENNGTGTACNALDRFDAFIGSFKERNPM